MKKYILKITLCIALFFTPLFISSLKDKGDKVNYNTKETDITLDEKHTTDDTTKNKKQENSDTDKKQENSDKNKKDEVTSREITINSFLKGIDYKKVTLKSQETLSTIARKYTRTCNPNTTVNLIRLLNNLTDVDNLDEGTVLLIPHKTLQNGSLYKVRKGNTWHNIWETRYPEYDKDELITFLITINALPNDDLPIDENIFLPKL